MKTPELIIVGYTNIDVNITPTRTTIQPGGAAYFVSLAASLFNKNVGLVTRVGNDFDCDFLLSRVNHDGIKFIANKNTSQSIQYYQSDTDHTQREIVLKKGVAEDLVSTDIPENWLINSKIIHIATMPPLAQREFLTYIKNKNYKGLISCDTDYSFLKQLDLRKVIIHNFNLCDIVFMNNNEYKLLFDQTFKLSVVKKDKDGALILSDNKIIAQCKTSKVKAIDSTGAGDIFAGVFLANLVQSKTYHYCLKRACKIATQSVEKDGIDHLFKQ